MCEACGPINPRPRTPEETAEHDRLMGELRQHLDNHLKQRGMTCEELVDSACYGSPRKKFTVWLQDTFFNFQIACGWV